jgi:small-conductance mechanosensitive channel
MFDLSTNFTNHIIDGLNNVLPRLPSALFDLLFGIILIRLAKRLTKVVMKAIHVQPGLRGVLSSIIETILWTFLLITLLNELGFNNVILFFTGSIAAIGIAMAAGGSTLISDIVAGIFLARDPDFNVGDEVIVGETPTLGIIESMDARRIRLRDENGVLHIIPNSIAERKEWVVVRRRPEVTALVKATKAGQRLAKAANAKRVAIVRKGRSLGKNEQ